MNRQDILERLQEMFREFTSDEQLALSEESTDADIEGWDSVTHIQIIFEAEEVFGVQFAADDIPNMTSVGAIIDAIEGAVTS
jgi:acyl carrier protein